MTHPLTVSRLQQRHQKQIKHTEIVSNKTSLQEGLDYMQCGPIDQFTQIHTHCTPHPQATCPMSQQEHICASKILFVSGVAMQPFGFFTSLFLCHRLTVFCSFLLAFSLFLCCCHSLFLCFHLHLPAQILLNFNYCSVKQASTIFSRSLQIVVHTCSCRHVLYV